MNLCGLRMMCPYWPINWGPRAAMFCVSAPAGHTWCQSSCSWGTPGASRFPLRNRSLFRQTCFCYVKSPDSNDKPDFMCYCVNDNKLQGPSYLSVSEFRLCSSARATRRCWPRPRGTTRSASGTSGPTGTPQRTSSGTRTLLPLVGGFH